MMHLYKAQAEPWIEASRDGFARIPDHADMTNKQVEHRQPTQPAFDELNNMLSASHDWLAQYDGLAVRTEWATMYQTTPKWLMCSSASLLKQEEGISRRMENMPLKETIALKAIMQQLYAEDNLQQIAAKTGLSMEVVDLVARYYTLEAVRVQDPKATTRKMVRELEYCYPSRKGLETLYTICDQVLSDKNLDGVIAAPDIDALIAQQHRENERLAAEANGPRKQSTWSRVEKPAARLALGALITATGFLTMTKSTEHYRVHKARQLNQTEEPVIYPEKKPPAQLLHREQPYVPSFITPDGDSSDGVHSKLKAAQFEQAQRWQERARKVRNTDQARGSF